MKKYYLVSECLKACVRPRGSASNKQANNARTAELPLTAPATQTAHYSRNPADHTNYTNPHNLLHEQIQVGEVTVDIYGITQISFQELENQKENIEKRLCNQDLYVNVHKIFDAAGRLLMSSALIFNLTDSYPTAQYVTGVGGAIMFAAASLRKSTYHPFIQDYIEADKALLARINTEIEARQRAS